MLPLISLFANLFLCFFILNINPKNRLNQLLSLFTLSLAIWSIGHYYMFNASSTADALLWKNIPTMGSIFTVIFLFHFTLFFTNNKYASKIIYLLPLYIFGCFLVFIEFTTPFLTESMKITYWGMGKNTAALYPVLSLSVFLLTGFSLIFLTKFFMKSSSTKIKKQTKLFIIGIIFPFIGGFITQVIAPMLGFEIVPVAALLTTITAFFIVFSVFRYSFVRPMSFSIQKKIVTIFFVFLFVMIFLTLSTVRSAIRSVTSEEVFNKLSVTAYSRADHVETLIKQDIQRLSLVSSRLQLRISLKSFINNSNETDKNFIIDNLNSANQSIDDFQDIFIMNLSGEAIVSTNPIYLNRNYSNKEFYIKGKAENSFFLILEDDTPMVYLSGPLILNEELLGVIVVISNPDTIFNILSDTKGLGETGESYLVNESGFVLSPLRFYNYSYNVENIILRKQIDTENYRNSMLHAIYSDEELKDKCEEIKILRDYRGENVLGTHVFISDMNWALLVEIDEEEAFSSVNNMQNIITVILTIIGLIILFAAFFYAKTFSEPIKKLDNYAKQITKGDLNIRADVKTSDEIGSLADSLNIMVENLKKYTIELEEKVDERTNVLQEKIKELEAFKKLTVGRELRMVELKKQIQEQQKNKNGDKDTK